MYLVHTTIITGSDKSSLYYVTNTDCLAWSQAGFLTVYTVGLHSVVDIVLHFGYLGCRFKLSKNAT